MNSLSDWVSNWWGCWGSIITLIPLTVISVISRFPANRAVLCNLSEICSDVSIIIHNLHLFCIFPFSLHDIIDSLLLYSLECSLLKLMTGVSQSFWSSFCLVWIDMSVSVNHLPFLVVCILVINSFCHVLKLVLEKILV